MTEHSVSGHLQFLPLYFWFVYLESPGYPQDFHMADEVAWRLRAVVSSKIVRLRVIDFTFATNASVLTIHDGYGPDAPLLRSTNSPRGSVFSSGPTMFLRLTPRYMNYGRYRFSVRALFPERAPFDYAYPWNISTAISTKNLKTEAAIELVALGYTQYIAKALSPFTNIHKWRIRSSQNTEIVHLEILDLEMEDAIEAFEFFDGTSHTSPLIRVIFANDRQLNPVCSTGPAMFIYLDSTYYYAHIRFKFGYTAVSKASSCINGHLTTTITTTTTTTKTPGLGENDDGCTAQSRPLVLKGDKKKYNVIQSPGYLSSYIMDSLCEWRITVEAGYVVVVNIMTVYNTYSPYCHYSSLEAFDGNSSTSRRLLNLCNNSSNKIVYSTGTEMYIRYNSNADQGRKSGFSLTYMAFPKSAESQNLLGVPSGSGHVWSLIGGLLAFLSMIVIAIVLAIFRLRRKRRMSSTPVNRNAHARASHSRTDHLSRTRRARIPCSEVPENDVSVFLLLHTLPGPPTSTDNPPAYSSNEHLSYSAEHQPFVVPNNRYATEGVECNDPWLVVPPPESVDAPPPYSEAINQCL